jgi:hypothetical protein
MVAEKYREDYDGEYVITNTTWANGEKIQDREWVPNTVTNNQISDRAIILYSTEIKQKYDPKKLPQHRGGLLGKKKLQVYAVDSAILDLPADFGVSSDRAVLEDIIHGNFNQRTICYTNTSNCIRYPGNFHLVPYSPGMSSQSLAVYLACFDGHKEVFIYNFSQYEDDSIVKQMAQVFKTYRGTKFYIVDQINSIPSQWNIVNVSLMSIRDWLYYCDV